MKTNAELSALVAEHVAGWKKTGLTFEGDQFWLTGEVGAARRRWISPDHFSTSADAVRELELIVDRDEVIAARYAKEIFSIAARNDFLAITASPRIRCVALLRAHGVEVEE